MNDYRPSPGYLVFNLSSDYENINFRYLDVMAEFLNLPLPKDPIFLKPGGISLSDYDRVRRGLKVISNGLIRIIYL